VESLQFDMQDRELTAQDQAQEEPFTPEKRILSETIGFSDVQMESVRPCASVRETEWDDLERFAACSD
jgi:hypothetical protein